MFREPGGTRSLMKLAFKLTWPTGSPSIEQLVDAFCSGKAPFHSGPSSFNSSDLLNQRFTGPAIYWAIHLLRGVRFDFPSRRFDRL